LWAEKKGAVLKTWFKLIILSLITVANRGEEILISFFFKKLLDNRRILCYCAAGTESHNKQPKKQNYVFSRKRKSRANIRHKGRLGKNQLSSELLKERN
jgi:hypothetical protein